MHPPSANAQLYSQQLSQHIREIIAVQGPITFAQFMELALYTPNLGYYQNGLQKFGPQGDFITAPEVSPLFGACIARQIDSIFSTLGPADLLEFGAGSGKLAADILSTLQELGLLPERYYILELSAELQERQKAFFLQYIPELMDRIIWLTTLPTTFKGIILANEVLDAMPVQRFMQNQSGIFEHRVAWQENAFTEQLAAADNALTDKIKALKIDVDDAYSSEINLMLPSWIASIANFLDSGVVLLIDYGFSRREYYHPDRNMGTLMCHYQHQAHSNPYWWPGLQDITAHVDFTAVAEAAVDANLQVAGYSTQAHFLLSCGATDLAANIKTDIKQQYQLTQGLKKLLLPSEMGELFKVIALTKNFSAPLLGFSLHDMREKL